MNSLTTKARYSPDQAMVWTENGMNTAVYDTLPTALPSTPSLATSHPNRGVLSAAPHINEYEMQFFVLDIINIF
jgi:hypothetical protein